MSILIKNVNIVNEGKSFLGDVFTNGDIIEQIGHINVGGKKDLKIIDGKGKYLFPGIIDAHVHFREPGLTHKGDIYSESKAAIAGGVTSFVDMPNTLPNTLSTEILDDKISIASMKSLANFSFFIGVSADNIDDVIQSDTSKYIGVSDDGLYFTKKGNLLADNPKTMEQLFANCKSIVAIHSEKEEIIERNEALFRARYGENIPFEYHSLIRSGEACYQATKEAIELARNHNTRLHILHLTTEAETHLFQNNIPLSEKTITTEVCAHHLWFSEKDYSRLGSLIKCNPSIKAETDRLGLLQALLDDRIDIISSDHAPHTMDEKCNAYFLAPSGLPMIQHSLIVMLELWHQGLISLEKIVEKMCHHVSELYHIDSRGYIREGYKADLSIVDLNSQWKVSKENILSKCGWSPLEGTVFKSKVTHTLVNGNVVYENGTFNEESKGEPLTFYGNSKNFL